MTFKSNDVAQLWLRLWPTDKSRCICSARNATNRVSAATLLGMNSPRCGHTLALKRNKTNLRKNSKNPRWPSYAFSRPWFDCTANLWSESPSTAVRHEVSRIPLAFKRVSSEHVDETTGRTRQTNHCNCFLSLPSGNNKHLITVDGPQRSQAV